MKIILHLVSTAHTRRRGKVAQFVAEQPVTSGETATPDASNPLDDGLRGSVGELCAGDCEAAKEDRGGGPIDRQVNRVKALLPAFEGAALGGPPGGGKLAVNIPHHNA